MKDRLNIQASTLGLGIATDLAHIGNPTEVLLPKMDSEKETSLPKQKSKHQLPQQASASWNGPYESC